MSTVEERVQAGAAWLDKRRPGWAAQIDLGALDLTDCTRCVLGQMFGSYWTALEAVCKSEDFDAQTHEAASLGFTVHYATVAVVPAAFAELTAAWRDLIATRLMG